MYWLEHGPTEKDGVGYVYLLCEVGTESRHEYKMGCTKRHVNVRMGEIARKNGKTYWVVWQKEVKFHKNVERALLEHLRALGMGLPHMKLPCVGKEDGGTEWVCGEHVIRICEDVIKVFQWLDNEVTRVTRRREQNKTKNGNGIVIGKIRLEDIVRTRVHSDDEVDKLGLPKYHYSCAYVGNTIEQVSPALAVYVA